MDKSRMIKSSEEIALLRESARHSSAAMRQLQEQMYIGMSEIEIADMLHALLRKNGVEPMTWGTIVASGENASDPHAKPTGRKTCPGEIVVVDFGAQFDGYASDITRSFFFGEISENLQTVFNYVLASYHAAMNCLKTARTTEEVELAHRKVFIDAGLDLFALRSLGHGLGKEIHEAPRLRVGETDTLAPGMVFTIEPGLYIPGLCGVRIEDDVLITDDGFELLTDVPLICKVEH
ncbi:MAG: M24 family metallopeptidase [Candidatus Cloacimonetes bacterium]|nr:M24 family metallopeptidase [Candidatus Cloacimonadota bacterium]